ncbi:MAG: aminotransferase class I/II-fold pyridoxal phosphate-dependent enzyme [Acidobacteriota bacterium]
MRHFELEKYFSRWEFTARHHMTASDMESLELKDLLALADDGEREAFNGLWLGYTETWGAPDLRRAIASTYEHLGAEHVLALAGAGEGIYAAMRVLLDRGDHAVVVVPNYQSAETVPLEVCQVSGVALREENRWRLDVDEVEAALRPNSKLISINFPHNPTGAIPDRPTFDALVELCRRRGLYLFSDEVYRGIELDPALRLPQVADAYEKGFSLNVLSKAYGLPGLRIGWLASQDLEALQEIERYKHYLSICNSAPSERLAVIALNHRETLLERNRSILRRNLGAIESFFDDYRHLFHWVRPQGGCVAFPRYLGDDGVEAFCRSLIEESGVLLLPASLYRSELMASPRDCFRIGYGRLKPFEEGLAALRQHLEERAA